MSSNILLTGNRTRDPRHKKWPLLVRSLSDSAKYRRSKNSKTETKALTLSLSDSRLFTHRRSSFLDLDLRDKDAETCSCGCEREMCETEEFSEDEGCFVITSVPQSQEEEANNKVSLYSRVLIFEGAYNREGL